MGFSSLNQWSKLGVVTKTTEAAETQVGHLDFSISSFSSSEQLSRNGSSSSLSESDSTEEVTSPLSSSSSSSPSSSSPSKEKQTSADPLQNMSSLLHQLPSKRGLSKHYQGKSQSFTSLSNVICLEDLAKTEDNSQNKKLKYCKSYACGLADQTYNSTSSSDPASRMASNSSRASCSSLMKRNSNSHANFLGSSRPPIPTPPHRSTSTSSFSSHTALFA